MKPIAYAVLLALGICSTIVTAFAEELPRPYSRRLYSFDEIYKHLYDLEGKVIKVKYTPVFPKQISKALYADNLNAELDPVYIKFSREKFGNYFNNKRQRPITIFVLVEVGEVQNTNGTISEGPVLMAVGTSIARDIRGNVTYK